MTFNDFRARIPIAEMAEYLGYWQDRSSGVGKTITYCLGNKKHPTEEIIIYPSTQTYWNRYGGQEDRGNLINFVQNRLDRFTNFPRPEKEGFSAVNEILNQYLNCPVHVNRPVQKYDAPIQSKFNLQYWNPRPLEADNSYLIGLRKLSKNTIDDFRSKLHIYSVGPNNHIAFPFRIPGQMEIVNFEMRNYFSQNNKNYKGFCSGGNRSSSCWIANFVPFEEVTDIYVFESAIDAMSFYEIKHFSKETTAAFVSTGGSVSQNQIAQLKACFPNVKWHSCADNDASGHIFDIQIAYSLEEKEFSGYARRIPEENKKSIYIPLENGEQSIIHEGDFSSSSFLKEKNIENIDIIKPKKGKDWNEQLKAYKRFDLNLSPVAKITEAVNNTLSFLILRGYHTLTSQINQDRDSIVTTMKQQSKYSISSVLAETKAYEMVAECSLMMINDKFTPVIDGINIRDKISQQNIKGEGIYSFLRQEGINIFKDIHSEYLQSFLEKHKLIVHKGKSKKVFDRVITASGWGLKESPLIKNNSADLGNSL